MLQSEREAKRGEDASQAPARCGGGAVRGAGSEEGRSCHSLVGGRAPEKPTRTWPVEGTPQ